MNACSSPTAACATATTKHRSNNSSNGVETRPRSSGRRADIGRYQGWVAAEGSLIAGGPIGRVGGPAADPDGPDPNLSRFFPVRSHRSRRHRRPRRRSVACHVDGTTQADFLPGSWDHRSASYGTTRRVVTPVGRGRLFDLHVLVSGTEVADDGVPGGRRD